jgi:uncharacterized protein with NAD-binding domain and iron-sulfur cluster
MHWSEKISKRLAEMQRDYAWLARQIGKKPSTVDHWKFNESIGKAENQPKADSVLKIARALKVPCEWLYDNDQDWPPPNEVQRLTTQPAMPAEILEVVMNALWEEAKRRQAEGMPESSDPGSAST